jgi:hypothetical protein
VFLVKASKPMTLGIPAKFDIRTYYHLLDLKKYPKNQWRDVIKEYQTIISMFSESFINLDELQVPQAFIDSRKKVKAIVSGTGQTSSRGPKLKGEVIGKRAEELMKWSDGRNCKFVPITYKLEEMHTHKKLRVYAHHDDYLKMDALYGLISKQKMEVVTFSQRELTILKDSEIQRFKDSKIQRLKKLNEFFIFFNLSLPHNVLSSSARILPSTTHHFQIGKIRIHLSSWTRHRLLK